MGFVGRGGEGEGVLVVRAEGDERAEEGYDW